MGLLTSRDGPASNAGSRAWPGRCVWAGRGNGMLQQYTFEDAHQTLIGLNNSLIKMAERLSEMHDAMHDGSSPDLIKYIADRFWDARMEFDAQIGVPIIDNDGEWTMLTNTPFTSLN